MSIRSRRCIGKSANGSARLRVLPVRGVGDLPNADREGLPPWLGFGDGGLLRRVALSPACLEESWHCVWRRKIAGRTACAGAEALCHFGGKHLFEHQTAAALA